MAYKVIIECTEEGMAASVADLPGCHSQGSSLVETLDNITIAIQEYLAVADELAGNSGD